MKYVAAHDEGPRITLLWKGGEGEAEGVVEIEVENEGDGVGCGERMRWAWDVKGRGGRRRNGVRAEREGGVKEGCKGGVLVRWRQRWEG